MPPRLDSGLISKISHKTDKPTQYIREQISKRARRLRVDAEAAQILWCAELGIGYASFFRHQPEHIKEQVHNAPRTPPSWPSVNLGRSRRTIVGKSSKKEDREILTAAINYIVLDNELRARCQDLLKASSHFDRVFREATTIFDHRLKTLSGIKKMNPLNLIGKTLNPDPQKAIIVVSSNNSEQEGFHSICKGLILAFRDTTHHDLSNKFSRQDALKFCGFVDTILGILGQASIHRERVQEG